MSKNYRHVPYDIAYKRVTGNDVDNDELVDTMSLKQLLNYCALTPISHNYSFKKHLTRNYIFNEYIGHFDTIIEKHDSITIYPEKYYKKKKDSLTIFDHLENKYTGKSTINYYFVNDNPNAFAPHLAYVKEKDKEPMFLILDLFNIEHVGDNHNEKVNINDIFNHRLIPILNDDGYTYFYDVIYDDDPKPNSSMTDFMNDSTGTHEISITIYRTMENVFNIYREFHVDNTHYEALEIQRLHSGYVPGESEKYPIKKDDSLIRKKDKNHLKNITKKINSGMNPLDIDADTEIYNNTLRYWYHF